MSDEAFGEILGKYVANVSSGVVARLAAHYRLLLRWNARINLTKIDAGEEMVRRHYAESLFLSGFVPRGSREVVDVGSGAGFPGVPIAVARPELAVTLVESDQRKTVFLRESTLDLPQIRVDCRRMEATVGDVDVIVARAVDVASVQKFAFQRGRWLGVLTSEEIAAKFDWDVVTALPWKPSSVIAQFHVKPQPHLQEAKSLQ